MKFEGLAEGAGGVKNVVARLNLCAKICARISAWRDEVDMGS